MRLSTIASLSLALALGAAGLAAAADEPLALGGDGVAAVPAAQLPAAPVAAPDDPEVPTFFYQYVLGSAFEPRSSNSTWTYDGNGCIHVTGGTEIRYKVPVVLPYQSVVHYVRVYYVDTSASDLRVWFVQYDAGISFTDIGFVDSTGTGGYGTALSADLNHAVDDALGYDLVFSWNGVTTSALQLCGVRIAYSPEPAIFLDGFEIGSTDRWSSTTF